jgi:hypothetical protein
MSIETDSVDSFYRLANQMSNELKLLLRLQAAGVAEKSDLERISELKKTLMGLQCSFCGQEVLTHDKSEQSGSQHT